MSTPVSVVVQVKRDNNGEYASSVTLGSMCKIVFSTGTNDRTSCGHIELLPVISTSSLSLFTLAISICIFIIVTTILVRGKAKVQSELKLAREFQAKGAQATQYEEIDIAQPPRRVVNVRENIAYGCGHMTRKL